MGGGADLVARFSLHSVPWAHLDSSGQAILDTLATGTKIEQLEVARANGRFIARCRFQNYRVSKAVTPEHPRVRVVCSRVATHHQRCEITGAGRAGAGGGNRRHRFVPQAASAQCLDSAPEKACQLITRYRDPNELGIGRPGVVKRSVDSGGQFHYRKVLRTVTYLRLQLVVTLGTGI
ncbi:hypothetical protein D3C81_1601800 [compost metagenome]